MSIEYINKSIFFGWQLVGNKILLLYCSFIIEW